MNFLFIYFNQEFRPRTLLSISLLEAIVKNEGHRTLIFDTSFYESLMEPWAFNSQKAGIRRSVKNLEIKIKTSDPYDDLKRKVENFQPHIIGFSYYSVQEKMQRELLLPLKKDFPNIKIIAGGPKPCINPEKSLEEEYIDMICHGEGETVIKEVCCKIESGDSLENIKGLWVKKVDGTVISNGISQLANLDDLPIQDWDSYDPIHIYGMYEGHAYRMGHVENTRGCPFNCSYCGSGSIKKAYRDSGQKKYVRHKSPKKIVEECRILKEKYDLELFYFLDGTFTVLPLDVLEELAERYSKKVNVPFIALVRADTICEKTARLLKKMNCRHASIGIESGDEEYRSRVLNRKMSDQVIIDAINYLKDNNIIVSSYNMIGLPGMDRKHVFKTIELNKLAKPSSSAVTMFMPFPDNELTKSLIEQKLIDPDNIIVADGDTPTVEIKEMDTKEIKGLYNTFNLYVRFPKWLYPFIKLLENENRITDFILKNIYKVIRK